MLNIKLFIVLLKLIFAFSSSESNNPIVEISNGKIQGRTQTIFGGGSYYAFQGIPYAAPPLGKLRFQAPAPAKNWNGVLNATKEGPICYQVKNDSPNESEDCLTINIFTPLYAPNNSTNLPVLFWIYGGAFRGGSANFYGTGPDWFIEQDVIVVTHNYRVGPFGFISTGDLVAPGNAGLKDQQMALKWTFDNIAFFGGDPAKITIAGESAGSASIGYQLLSPGSSGLFRGAIAESGSPLNAWAFTMNPKPYVADLIKIIDPSTNFTEKDDSQTLVDFLVNVDAKQIDDASKPAHIRLTLPVVEPDHSGAFITQTMYEAFEGGNFNQVPTIIGCNSEEEILMLHSSKATHEAGRAFDANLETLIPANFNTKEKRLTVAKHIKHIYTTDQETFGDCMNQTIRYMSDNGFTRGIIRQGELMSKFSDVYFYILSYDGELGGWDKTVEGAEKVCHGEDLKYLWVFRGSNSNEDLSKFPLSDITTHKRLIKLWTNFVKYLNATPDPDDELLQKISWPKVQAQKYQYLDIGEDLSVKTNPKESYLKWLKVYEKFAEKPYVTF